MTTITSRLASGTTTVPGTHPQAGFFDALARHLRLHPHLPEVNLCNLFGEPSLQVRLSGRDLAAGLLAWAHTLPVHTLTIRALDDGTASTRLHATLDGHPVVVWGHLYGIADWLGLRPGDKHTSTVDVLHRYAEEANR